MNKSPEKTTDMYCTIDHLCVVVRSSDRRDVVFVIIDQSDYSFSELFLSLDRFTDDLTTRRRAVPSEEALRIFSRPPPPHRTNYLPITQRSPFSKSIPMNFDTRDLSHPSHLSRSRHDRDRLQSSQSRAVVISTDKSCSLFTFDHQRHLFAFDDCAVIGSLSIRNIMVKSIYSVRCVSYMKASKDVISGWSQQWCFILQGAAPIWK